MLAMGKRRGEKKRKEILVCGAGSIGVYIGAMLNLYKHNVKLLGRRKLHKVHETIVIDGKTYDVPEKLFKLPKNYKADVVFVTTKLYDFGKMIKLIKKKRIKYSKIAAVQNGLVDSSPHSKYLGHRIIPVTVFAGFNLTGKEIIVKPTKTGWIVDNSSSGREISSLLADAEIPCKPKRNFDSLRAEKTIVNCCLNALSAIEEKPFNKLFKDKKTRQRIHKIFEETYNILKKNYSLADKSRMEKEMFRTWSKLKHYSSTYQDIKSGRKNEVPYFNGYIVELGRKYGLPTEQNRRILEEVRKIAK